MYLAKESIEFGYEAADWRDAVRQAGKLLLNGRRYYGVLYRCNDKHGRGRRGLYACGAWGRDASCTSAGWGA